MLRHPFRALLRRLPRSLDEVIPRLEDHPRLLVEVAEVAAPPPPGERQQCERAEREPGEHDDQGGRKHTTLAARGSDTRRAPRRVHTGPGTRECPWHAAPSMPLATMGGGHPAEPWSIEAGMHSRGCKGPGLPGLDRGGRRATERAQRTAQRLRCRPERSACP